MEQDSTFKHGGEPDPIDTTGLCLLSLDGGGVRGLSSLYILKSIMDRLNHVRREGKLSPVKPCEVFDLIGGTSTGGLIAIMLGRLEMDVDKCIDAYSYLTGEVFGKKLRSIPVNFKGDITARFDSAKLESAIQKVIEDSGASKQNLFNDGTRRGCRTFVCTADRHTKDIVRLRSYSLSHEPNIRATICQAALATSAATTFFEPVNIGDRSFADGGLGANNPVDEVEGEASNIWCPETGDLKRLVKCFISIGTGDPGKKPFEDSMMKFLGQTVVQIATQTGNTASKFIAKWAKQFDEKRYFRFNVEQGLQKIGLEEHKKKGAIEAATESYLRCLEQKFRVRDCIQNMRLKENQTGTDFSTVIQEYTVRWQAVHRFAVPLDLTAVPVTGDFVGRQDELDNLWQYLQPKSSRSRKVAILHGLGGIGKTQLALRFARDHKDDFTAIFWLSGKDRGTLLRSLSSILPRLPGQSQNTEVANNEEMEQRARELLYWLALDGNSRWLIIFDSVDQYSPIRSSVDGAYDIREFFPTANHGSILITTRLQRLIELGRPFPVKRLGSNDAIQLLLQSSGLSSRNSMTEIESNPDILALAVRLDGLPLAIVIAGAFMRETGTSITNYLQYYQESWFELHSKSSPGRQYQKGNMFQTWMISYNEVKMRDPDAAKLLLLLACFDNRDIWYELVHCCSRSPNVPAWLKRPVSDKLAFKSSLKTLIEFSLIESKQHEGSYSMHPVVQEWCLNVAGAEGRLDLTQLNELALICVGYSVPSTSDKNYSELQRRLIPHANHVRHGAWRDGNIAVMEACHNIGNLNKDQGKLKEAEEMYQQALSGREMALGPDHASTLDTVNNLGRLYRIRGNLKKAEMMSQRALAGYEKTLGPGHPSTLNTVNNLGRLYIDQGKLKEAEMMYQRALSGYEKALSPDHTSTLDTVNNIGSLYVGQGKLKEAEEMFQRALTGYERALGPDHTSTLDTVNNIGSLYVGQGKLKEAEEMFQRALTGYERALGPDHTCTLDTVNNIGSLYVGQGKLKEAEEMFQQALTGYEKALGPDNTPTLATINNIGNLYSDRGRLKEAEEMFQQALAGYEKALGPDHTSTLNTVNNLGRLYVDQGKLKEAEMMYQRALSCYEKTLGPDHLSTLDTVNNLGRLYRIRGNLKKAEMMSQRALAGYEKTLGPGHPSTLNTVNNLGRLYVDQGKLKKAEDMFQRALSGYEKTLGPDHLSTLDTVNNLGRIYRIQDKLKEAEMMYQRALAGREVALGPDHTSTLVTVNNLGNLYSDQGKLKEAEEMYQQALAGYEKALGPDHTSTLVTVNNLGNLYSDQGKLKEAEKMYQRALAGYKKALGPDHTCTLDTVKNIGSLYQIQGKLKEAEEMYQRAPAYDHQASISESLDQAETSDEDSGKTSVVSDVPCLVFSSTSLETISSSKSRKDARQSAPEHLAKILSDDPFLQRLYAQAMQKIGRNRFLKTHDRLLRRYLADLRLETQDRVVLELVRILQHRSRRQQVTVHVLEHFQPTSNLVKENALRKFLDQTEDREYRLRSFLQMQSEDFIDTTADIAGMANMMENDNKSTEEIGRNEESGYYVEDASNDDEEEEDVDESDEEERAADTIDEAKLQHLHSVVAFFTKGRPFEAFKSSFANFLNPPLTIEEAVASGNIEIIRELLKKRSHLLAAGEYSWLHELDQIGYTPNDIADVLLEQAREGPWILDELPQDHTGHLARRDSHIPGCIHQLSCEIPQQHYLDTGPASLCEKLDSHNELILKVQGFCGLGGVIPVSENQDEWDGTINVALSGATVSYLKGSEQTTTGGDATSKLFIRAKNALKRTLQALGCVQEQGLCCDSFTALICDRTSEPDTRLQLVRINIEPALRLYQDLSRLTREYDSEYELQQSLMREQEHLLDSTARILGPLQACLDDVSHFEDITSCILQHCILSVQFFSLGFVSYVQGHCSVLRPFFIDHGLEHVTLCGIGAGYTPNILCSLVKLSCLDSMLESPVFAFSKRTDNVRECEISPPQRAMIDDEVERFNVLTTSVDLIDTWGPAKVVSERTQPSLRAAAILIRGGLISMEQVRSDTPLLHWSRAAAIHGDCKSFSLTQNVEVGGPLVVNDTCVTQFDRTPLNPSLPSEVLGPFESYWRLASRQVGASVGVGEKGAFNLQANQGWLKEPECTIKGHFQAEPEKYQIHWLLDSPWAIQISVCTGAAQRVKLRELVADLLPIYTDSRWNPPDWKDLWEEHQIFKALRSADDLQQWGRNLNSDSRGRVEALVRELLLALVPTGLDKKGNLVICLPSRDNFKCIKLSCQGESYWARMLADSSKIATFAYMTPRCLEASHLKCQALSAFSRNPGSLLGTAVCLDVPAICEPNAAKDCSLKQSQTYWIGRSDLPLLVKAECACDNYQRLRAFKTWIPENTLRRLMRKTPKLRECHLGGMPAQQVVVQVGNKR